ncbi:MAG: TylF/MycF/NovP-related O-methyltransferase [Actinomycetes bacterium]
MSEFFVPYEGRFFDVASLVPPDRLYILETLMYNSNKIDGDFIECGVYKGGTAKLALRIMSPGKKIYLFDTFCGMPPVNKALDSHKEGDFSDLSLSIVESYLSDERAIFNQGLIPDTFQGLESLRISFAHIDVDIYKSVKDSFRFIYPRLVKGGIAVCDDYGSNGCRGARAALDECCDSLGIRPLVLPTGQAIIFKNE